MHNSILDDDKPEWLVKCKTCTHYYVRKSDADTVYCRCRKGCNYKAYKEGLKKR